MSERHYHSGYLSVSSRGTDYRIPIDSILYIESNNRKLTIHTEEETYSCYEKLNVMEQNLYQSAFVRCHQSYLVAADQIAGYDDHNILLSGSKDQIPVSRQYQKKIRTYLQTQPTGGTLLCTAGIYQGSLIRIKAEQSVLIGRDGHLCDIVINLPLVSRVHCEMLYHKNTREYILTDHSSNGTFLAGAKRLVPEEAYTLQPGAEICFGDPHNIYRLL